MIPAPHFFFKSDLWSQTLPLLNEYSKTVRTKLGGSPIQHHAEQTVLGSGISFEFHTNKNKFMEGFDDDGLGADWLVNISDDDEKKEIAKITKVKDQLIEASNINLNIEYVGTPYPKQKELKINRTLLFNLE